MAALSFKCDMLWAQLEAIDRRGHAAGCRIPMSDGVDAERPRLADGRPPRTSTRSASGTSCSFPRARSALNPTAVTVLELCDGKRTLDEIAAELSERYRDGAEIGDDVEELIAAIAAQGTGGRCRRLTHSS